MHPLGSSLLLEIVSVGLWPCWISATFTRRLQLLVSCSIYLTSHCLSEWSPHFFHLLQSGSHCWDATSGAGPSGCVTLDFTITKPSGRTLPCRTFRGFTAVTPPPASSKISCCSSAVLYHLHWVLYRNSTINPHLDAPIIPLGARLTSESHQTTSLKFY